jgi:hypothetical protein
MSTSILIARRSAAADLLTSCVTTASRSVISALLAVDRRRHPLVERLDQQCGQIFRARSARVAGLALLEAGVHRRLAAAHRIIALVLGHGG